MSQPLDVANFRGRLLCTCSALNQLKTCEKEWFHSKLTRCLDEGAWRTMTAYYANAPQHELQEFLVTFYMTYYGEIAPLLSNPSAAVVSMCRKLYWLKHQA